MQNSQVAIIGAGPAGMAAAIQLERYAIHPLLFEGKRMGGLLWNANLIENYPGFVSGIPGPELVERFIEQVGRSKIVATAEQVNRLSFQEDVFRIETEQQVYLAGIAVIASGTKPKTLTGCDIDPEARDRIYYEVYPLLDRKDCRIAIIGAGDAAFDYALSLAPKNEVIILNRGEATKCLPLLWERIAASPGIIYHPKTRLTGLTKSASGKVLVACRRAQENVNYPVDYLLCATGREAQLDFMSAMEQAQVERLENEGRLYFIGDVKNGIYRQTAIAVGDGIYSGMKIFQHFKETGL